MSNARRSLVLLGGACCVAIVSALSFGRAVVGLVSDGAAERQPVEQEVQKPKKAEESEADAKAAEREAFVSTWAERIDAFNAGYPLEGYGRTFAEAAYDNGVDPRFSPAIARVESGSGQSCAYSCNAWGWGASSWPDWDTAIREHVSGLAAGYGHTLTYDMAYSYNELNPDEWYAQVESCMYQIWGDESL